MEILRHLFLIFALVIVSNNCDEAKVIDLSSKDRIWSAVPIALLRMISQRSDESRAVALMNQCPLEYVN